MMIQCPWCRDQLDLNDELFTQQHLAEHLRVMREGAPDVEADPQDGCENLAPWTREDFQKNRTHELRGDEGEEDPHRLTKDKDSLIEELREQYPYLREGPDLMGA